jgi:hypothetical protein
MPSLHDISSLEQESGACEHQGSRIPYTRTRYRSAATPCALWPEAVRWGKRGARFNTISPGIIITPLANVGALLMGPKCAFIIGSDFLMDGGVAAAYWFGDLAPRNEGEESKSSVVNGT